MVKKAWIFLGYNDDDFTRPLCIRRPQMIEYVNHFDSNKTISFKVNDDRLFKNILKYWEELTF